MSKPSILIIDDNPMSQRVLQLVSERYNIDTTCVSSCDEALQALEKSDSYTAVLLDWKVHDQDGLECTRRIREREKQTKTHIPIIAVTANAMVGDREKCFEAGMDDYLSKPFQMEDFARIVRRWLPPKRGGNVIPWPRPQRPNAQSW